MKDHLIMNKLFPSEHKGSKWNLNGTKVQILIGNMILENCRKTNLHVTWIDYKSNWDSLLYDWILKCLNMIEISDNIRNFVKHWMAPWTMQLTLNGENVGEVDIWWCILQGDSLSPLLWVIALIPLSNIRHEKGHR